MTLWVWQRELDHNQTTSELWINMACGKYGRWQSSCCSACSPCSGDQLMPNVHVRCSNEVICSASGAKCEQHMLDWPGCGWFNHGLVDNLHMLFSEWPLTSHQAVHEYAHLSPDVGNLRWMLSLLAYRCRRNLNPIHLGAMKSDIMIKAGSSIGTLAEVLQWIPVLNRTNALNSKLPVESVMIEEN